MSTIPKHSVTNEEMEAAKQVRDYLDKEGEPRLLAIYNAGRIIACSEMKLATDGREELEKENGELKRDKVYWQLEAQAKHNANEQLRKELLKANNSYDEQFNQITALQSQCTEKDQEIERLKQVLTAAENLIESWNKLNKEGS